MISWTLPTNAGEASTIIVALLFGMTLPVTPVQILWINLVTDGAPALALGVDPSDAGVMEQPPRPPGERVITGGMWRAIVLVGVVMAAGTLTVLDASMPGGFIEGPGDLRYGQTMAFATLMLFQLFNVFNARSSDRSAFHRLFTNHWLWWSILISLLLQALVLYVPPLQRAFGTVPLTFVDWGRCAIAASSVLWVVELAKLMGRARKRPGGRNAGLPNGSARRAE